MKTLIVYSSQTGNTKKLAEAVYNQIDGDKTICPVNEAPDPAGFDRIVLGFWLMGGKPDPKSADYLAKIGNAELFLFATHGAAAESPHAQEAMGHAISLAPSARIAGTYSCQGEVKAAVLEKIRMKDPQPPWIADASSAIGHPDQGDIEGLSAAAANALPNN